MTHRPEDMTWSQRAAAGLVNKLPPILVRETERIGLSFGFICVGLISILNINQRQAIVNGDLSKAAVLNWSIMLIMGGSLTIWGMVASSRLIERAGITLSMIGCLIYAVVVLIIGTTISSLVVGVLFLALFAIKLIRLLVSTVQQANSRHRIANQGE